MSYIPAGWYRIHNVSFPSSVVDLFGSQPTGNLIGHHMNVPISGNQIWYVQPQGGDLYRLEAQSPAVFAAEAASGATLNGSNQATNFSILRASSAITNLFTISASPQLLWTLTSGDSGTNITLEPAATGSEETTQQWTLEVINV